MRRTSIGLFYASTALAVTAAGCASGPNLPDYVEPKLAPEKVARIEGFGATYVAVVDNAKAPGSLIRMTNFGGNTVKLTPGRHRITVSQSDGNRFSITTHTVAFTYDFKAGHEYRIGPRNRLNPFNRELALHDDTAESVTNVGGSSDNVSTERTDLAARPDLPCKQLAPTPNPVLIGQ